MSARRRDQSEWEMLLFGLDDRLGVLEEAAGGCREAVGGRG
jgi:hypothetical protein